ncbi:MAG TPA: HlyD family secretion protein [Lichenihabitans sp.]|jgi:multidrug resistance efflux pump|nr:HlyD family secretion protein [Lichenihabitans sp.]
MSEAATRAQEAEARDTAVPQTARPGSDATGPRSGRPKRRRWLKLLGMVVTLGVVGVAAVLSWQMWQAYMASPWTRDGTVRVYVASMAPQVSGQVVALPVHDNQFVHKGDLLMKVDPRDYKIAVDLAQAQVDQAKVDLKNKQSQAARRQQLTDLAATAEERETYLTAAQAAQATLEQQQANLEKAKVSLDRTEIRSPVNGWVTNLILQQGDYADTGQRALSIVNADSFWVDGYFEETLVKPIKEGDPAKVWLMGYREVIDGHVDSVARGISTSNATPNGVGLATVNPVFTWVRLAQRVPVRIHLDHVPPDVRLVGGMTATVEIEPKPAVGTAGTATPVAPAPSP